MSLSASKSKCPSCLKSDIRELDGQCAVCLLCSETKHTAYRFCWACQREWPSTAPTNCACTLPNCALRAVLLSPKRIKDTQSPVYRCPYFRACPHCKALVTHDGDGCRNIECPQCATEFCFRCLRKQCYTDSLDHDSLRTPRMRRCKIVNNSTILKKRDL